MHPQWEFRIVWKLDFADIWYDGYMIIDTIILAIDRMSRLIHVGGGEE